MTDEFQIDHSVPFTLSCEECDAASPETYEEAVAAGWTEIVFFPQGSAENYLGLCPDCRRRFDEEAAAVRKGVEAQKGGDACPT
ncbi:MAG: hypothetical protein KF861_05820 [Planctomycetaceae bacterium]|nr:hypothetical protein [Planctomycetaceae bacterium]